MRQRFKQQHSLVVLLLCTGFWGLGAQTPSPASKPAWQLLVDRSAELLAAHSGQRSIPGEDGWLFLAAELEHLAKGGSGLASSPGAKEGPLAAILDFHRQLSERGIELILLPVPEKAAVYPDKLGLGRPLSTSRLDHGSAAFLADLKARGVPVLDLMPLLLEQRNEGHEVYCASDAHWSPWAARIAAKEIAALLASKAWYRDQAKVRLHYREETLRFAGDLAPKGSQPLESHPARIATNTAGEFLDTNSESPILLLGDSHTLVFQEGGDRLAQGAGLFDQPAAETGLVPDLIGIRGSGATASRVSLYRKARQDPQWISGKKLIIWCFSARDFTAPASNWKIVPVAP